MNTRSTKIFGGLTVALASFGISTQALADSDAGVHGSTSQNTSAEDADVQAAPSTTYVYNWVHPPLGVPAVIEDRNVFVDNYSKFTMYCYWDQANGRIFYGHLTSGNFSNNDADIHADWVFKETSVPHC